MGINKSTPRPWRWRKPKTGKHSESRWIMGDGLYVAKVYGGSGKSPEEKEGEANAKLIVEAVNAYEQQAKEIKALKEVIKDIQILHDLTMKEVYLLVERNQNREMKLKETVSKLVKALETISKTLRYQPDLTSFNLAESADKAIAAIPPEHRDSEKGEA